MIISKEIGTIFDDTTMTWGNPVFINAKNKPFELFGFVDDYYRLPRNIAKNVSEKVDLISKYSCI